MEARRGEITAFDVIIVGAGAAGLMCAIEAGKRGRSVLVLERNEDAGAKILISGGGRCNFTNLNVESDNFLSQNPHFCKSALSRYSPADFVALVVGHGITYHEKKLGQLFCDKRARQIVEMLLAECTAAGVQIRVGNEVKEVGKNERFELSTSQGTFVCDALVLATGGLSLPQLGATNFAFSIARQFGLAVTRLKPGLVPLTFTPADLKFSAALAGVSVDSVVSCGDASFRENILFTHRGLSGPGILQASSYWDDGESIVIDLLPEKEGAEFLLEHYQSRKELMNVLDQHLPRRLALEWCGKIGGSKLMNRFSRGELKGIAGSLHRWEIFPRGTEGFGKAEVTVGGVDTDELSSRTMESRAVPGLYFIGECVDVTGWLGGYNFQWAWSSGWVSGQYV